MTKLVFLRLRRKRACRSTLARAITQTWPRSRSTSCTRAKRRTKCWTFHTPNDKPAIYQTFVLSGRAGTHHIINTMYNVGLPDGGFATCADPGHRHECQHHRQPAGRIQGVQSAVHGRPEKIRTSGARSPRMPPPKPTCTTTTHRDQDLIREFWMNIYYVDKPDRSPRTPSRSVGWVASPGQETAGIAAGSDMVYKYSVPIKGEGRSWRCSVTTIRMVAASLLRSSAQAVGTSRRYSRCTTTWIRRRSSTTRSANPAFSDDQAGAVSGMLDVHDGDTLMWECHIVNDSNIGLTYTNALKTGEMCNLWGASLGISPLNCVSCLRRGVRLRVS